MRATSLLLGLGAGALALALLQLTRAEPTGAPVPQPGGPASTVAQGHVYCGITEQPEHLNPFTVQGGVARRYVLGFTHDTLLDTDPATGALRPALATSHRIAADGLAIEFELREGVVFSDGTSCTPEDVLFTWQASRAVGGAIGSMRDGLGLVRDARIVGSSPSVLHVDLHSPHFASARAVGESWVVVQRRFFEREVARLAAERGVPVPASQQDPAFGELLASLGASGPGTGPYMLGTDAAGNVSWRRNLDLELVRNVLSWRKRLQPRSWNLSGIRLLFLGDEAARHSALVERRIDWYQATDPDQVLAWRPELLADYRKVTYDYQALGCYLVLWNNRTGPLADARVRAVVDGLFDRESIARDIFRGAARPAFAYFKPGSDSYPDGVVAGPVDPVAARERLAAYGFSTDSPLRIRLLVPAGFEPGRRMAELFVAAARDAGIVVELRQLDWALLAQAEQRGEWDGLLRMQGHRSWVDPYELFHSRGTGNAMGWSDAEADRLLETARTTHDDFERARLNQRFNAIVTRDVPVSFLVHPLASMLFNRHIQDAVPGPLGLWPEPFWVPPEHQRR